ncbi:Charged multivesicular body protein 1 [Babesia sp. Xinjiang]|uniref:Charged multivesicular body protein 1 n=1 Tax=Babesia sp. Xinjiang TaxID=462227 RepID=UPI000A2620E8|nr:Charged multivesicular body protein 1 [Babesia sp. Xinjiang]ORM39771.1 Charged multivesicular body protein 1 [Babesia sp. Xinjiang]
MGGGQSLMSTSFNLRLQAREVLKLHAQCEREEESEKLKVKRALEKGNVEAARVHAGNAIRKHNEALRFLQYHAKLEILRHQVDSADRTNKVTCEMRKALPQLRKIANCKSMDSASLFNQFEKIFEDMEVAEAYTDQTMSDTTAHLAPQLEVDTLISKVADEHALDIGTMLDSARAIRGAVSNRNDIGKLAK